MQSARGNYKQSQENERYISRTGSVDTIAVKNRFVRGKYYGLSIEQVKKKDNAYYNWAYKNGLLGDY